MKLYLVIIALLGVLNISGQELTQDEFNSIRYEVQKNISHADTNKDFEKLFKAFKVPDEVIFNKKDDWQNDTLVVFNDHSDSIKKNFITPFFNTVNSDNSLLAAICSISIVPNKEKDLSELGKATYHFILRFNVNINKNGEINYNHYELLTSNSAIKKWWLETNGIYVNVTGSIYDEYGYLPPPPIPNFIKYSPYHLTEMTNKYLNSKNFDKAEKYVNRLIKQNSNNPEGYLKRGFIKLAKSNGKEGCNDIEKA